MNWKKLLEWTKQLRSPGTLKWDKKLIQNVRRKFFPSWKQYRYLNHFLTAVEKRTLVILIATFLVSLLAWSGLFLAHHSGSAPKSGGEYKEAMVGQPKYINPIYGSVNDVDSDLSGLIFSGLFRYDTNQNLVPDLAESYTVSTDLKNYEITLRSDARWSDGKPLTADDVIFTIETIKNPEVGSPLLPAFEGIQAEKISDYVIKLTLKEPFANFLNTLTTGILPEHVWSDVSLANYKLTKYNLQPIGSGPWQFNKMLKDEAGTVQSYSLMPNQNYYGTKPYLKIVEFKFSASYAEAITQLKSQAVNGVSFLPSTSKDKVGTKNFNIYQFLLPQTTAVFFNTDAKSALKDLDLRRALAMGIDRQKIIDDGQNKNAVATDSPLPAFYPGYQADTKNQYNPDQANTLLDKEWKRVEPEQYFNLRKTEELKNYQDQINDIIAQNTTTPELASSSIAQIEDTITKQIRAEMHAEQTFYRANKNNIILKMTLTVVDSPEYVKTGEAVAKFWRKLGIPTTIQPISSSQINREIIKPRTYEALLYGEVVGPDLDLFPFWHSSQIDYPGLNLARYTNRAADKLLEDARLTLDNNKKIQLYGQFQTLVANDVPAIFLFSPYHLMAIDKSIKGVNLSTLVDPSNRYNDLGQWFVKTQWKWQK